MRRISPIFLLLLPGIVTATEVPASLDRLFTEAIRAGSAPGISVAVARQGKIVYRKGFGMADLQNQVKVTPKTVFRIGSITKQFAATIVMQLESEGKLRLDDRLDKYVPEVPEAWRGVTITQLLNHTSGIPSYTEVPGLFANQILKPTTPQGIWKVVAEKPMDFEPGKGWHYNNTGYCLLGLVIEKADGRSFGEALSARILRPLDMSQTVFTSEAAIVPFRAQGYARDAKGWQNCAAMSMTWPYSAGSMESTVEDLAKWDAALYGDRVLSQAALRRMWTPTKLPDGKNTGYGFAWSISQVNGVEVVEHGGGINGFTSYIMRTPSLGWTVIVLGNNEAFDMGVLARRALDELEPKLRVPEAKPIADQRPELTKSARIALEGTIAGKLDRSLLTPQFSALLSDADLAEGASRLQGYGRLVSFDLMKEEPRNGGWQRNYRAKFALGNISLNVIFDAEGKIAGLGMGS